MANEIGSGKKNKEKRGRGREGLGAAALGILCRRWTTQTEYSCYLGPLETLLGATYPEWHELAEEDKVQLRASAVAGVSRRERPAVFADFLDGLFWDSRAVDDSVLVQHWILYVKSLDGRASPKREALINALNAIRKLIKTMRTRELYYLLLLRDHLPDEGFRDALRLRFGALKSAQIGRGIFGKGSNATWEDHQYEFEHDKYPFLATFPSLPREALRQVMATHHLISGSFRLLCSRSYDFLPLILSAPAVDALGRHRHAEMIDAFVEGEGNGPIFSIVGTHGTGKTTLLRGYLREQYAKVHLFPCMFLDGQRGQRAQPRRVLEHLIVEASPAYASSLEMLAQDERDAEERFLESLARFTGESPSTRTVIFIDALDESEADFGDQLSLTQVLLRMKKNAGFPHGVRFVLTSRPSDEFMQLVESYDINLDSDEEQEKLISRFLASELMSAGVPADAEGISELSRRSGRSFSYSELLIRRLKGIGHIPDDWDSLPADPAEMLSDEWNRLQRGPLTPGETRTLVAVLLAHRGSPSLSELCLFTGQSPSKIADFFRQHGDHFDIDSNGVKKVAPDSRVRGFHFAELAQYIGVHELWPNDVLDAHSRIVEGCQKQSPEQPWWKVDNDGYFWGFLPYHLQRAGRQVELRALLSAYDWVREKLLYCGCASLQADYSLIDDSKSDAGVKRVRDALNLASHVLHHKPDELPAQLYGRLIGLESDDTKRLLQRLGESTQSPWFRVLTPSLHQVSGALLRTLRGHRDSVNGVAYSEDLGMIVSASSDKTVRLWDFSTGKEEATLGMHEKSANSVCVASKASLVVSGGDDGKILIWDLKSREKRYVLENLEGAIRSAAISEDGEWLIAGDKEGNVLLWLFEPDTQPYLRKVGRLNTTVRKTVIDAEKGFFAALSEDGEFRVWMLDEELPEILRAQESAPGYQDIAWVPTTADSKCLLYGLAPLRARMWCFEVGRDPQEVFSNGVLSASDHVGIGRKYFLSDKFDDITVRDLDAGKMVGSLCGHTGPITSILLTSDERAAISASTDHTLKIWDLSDLSAFGREVNGPPRHSGQITALESIPRSPFAVSASTDKTIHLWNMQTGESSTVIEDSGGGVTALAVAPDGSMFATGTRNGVVSLFSSLRAKLKWTAKPGDTSVGTLAFSMKCRILLAGGEDGSIQSVSLKRGREVSVLGQHNSRIMSLAVSSDDAYLLSFSQDKEFKVWDLHAKSLMFSDACRYGRPIFLEHEGLSVCGAESAIGLGMWPVKTEAKSLHRFGLESLPILAFRILAAHPSEPWVMAAGGQGGKLAAWNLADGTRIQEWDGHDEEITRMLISASGQLVASASRDHTFAVWQHNSPHPLCTFTAESAILACCSSEDFRTFAVGEESGRVHLLHLENV